MHYLYYKDQELPIQIDFAVIKVVCSKLGLKLSQFEQAIDNPEQTEVVVLEALKRGHKLEGKTFEYKDSEIEDILSVNYGEFLKVFSECVLAMFSTNHVDKKK